MAAEVSMTRAISASACGTPTSCGDRPGHGPVIPTASRKTRPVRRPP